ncbi:sigma-54 interaction domain-containing protein [Desulfogranum mediterraneum]|uniref:sigma-54 interaction domain-containing protein n=1 Tax=Desulfogranum mediterraneum TaxID=160661 RepID=UPI000420F20F|nr:sigma 54-interacting transcriptional regulator [Desulfogranum mediterraneum]
MQNSEIPSSSLQGRSNNRHPALGREPLGSKRRIPAEAAGRAQGTSSAKARLKKKTTPAGKRGTPRPCSGSMNSDQDSFSSNILDSIPDGAFTVNHNFEITSFNRAAEIITGFNREEAIGMKCYDLFRANICREECALRKSIETGRDVFNRKYTIKDIDGDDGKIIVSTSVLRDSQRRIIGGVETFRDISTSANFQKKIDHKYSFQNIISKNKKIQKIFSTLPCIARSNSTVLIEGDSGSGKELFARAIHNLSERQGAFVALNCAALPDALLESELFGYKKGAFTGAAKDKLGRFSLAAHGTIFLDEIGDISPALQLKLLRVLQEKEFEALGGTTTISTDARVIAATNKNLKEQVKQGLFRSDLYFRLNVIHISLPPFSERREDIPLLVQHFFQKFQKSQKKNIESICPSVLNILMQYDYPGNIRELENIIEHCFVMCEDQVIDVECLPEELVASVSKTMTEANDPAQMNPLSNAEASTIWAALHRFDGHRAKTAAHLNIDKTTLWRKMKKYEIHYPLKK